MAKALLVMAGLASSAVPALTAQGIELAPFVGYRAGGSFLDRGGRELHVRNNASFGAVVDLDLRRDIGVEFVWSHEDSHLPTDPALLGTASFDVKVDHWMVGAWKEFWAERPTVRPLISVLFGVTHFSSGTAETDARDRVVLAPGAGAEFFPFRRVGFRLDGRGYFVFTEGGSQVFCIPSGACALLFKSDLMVQTDVALSVVFLLGRSRPPKARPRPDW